MSGVAFTLHRNRDALPSEAKANLAAGDLVAETDAESGVELRVIEQPNGCRQRLISSL